MTTEEGVLTAMAGDLRRALVEIDTLKAENAEMSTKISRLLIGSGLDTYSGRGYQYFGDGRSYRLGPSGIEFKTGITATPALYFLPAFSNTPSTDKPSVGIRGRTESPDEANLLINGVAASSSYWAFYGAVSALANSPDIEAYMELFSNSSGATTRVGMSSDDGATYAYVSGGPLELALATSDYAALASDGRMQYRSDTDKIRARINGVTENVATESYVGSTAAPIAADYLVGTANGTLTGEIVAGTAPGGELGGTWASPTVDATHSGSAHHAAVTASGAHTMASQDITAVASSATLSAHVELATDAEVLTGTDTVRAVTPAGLKNSHTDQTDPHTGYVREADANWVDLTDSGATTLHSHAGGGAPDTADYLVGTAQGGLSAEIVVGTAPGGELGNTWASPTVDATHSGSAHTDFIAKTIVDAKGDLIGASAADTPVKVAAGGADGWVLGVSAAASAGLTWTRAIMTSVTSQAGNYTAVHGDLVVYTGTGGHTLTLPDPSANDCVVLKNNGTGGYTVDGNGSDTIDGSLTIVVGALSSVTMVAISASAWILI